MELSYKQKIYFSENWPGFQEITFISEFPGRNVLLPTFLTGGKWDFQVANLLLATVNFEPWNSFSMSSSLVGFPRHNVYVFTNICIMEVQKILQNCYRIPFSYD